MKNMSAKRRMGGAASLLLLVFALWPLTGSANMGIPGPMIILGSYFYGEGFLRWILVNMAMCISVEGFVFLYAKEYRRPFAASACANIVSLVLGYPILCFLFLPLDNELLISLGCTIGSFFIEYHALKLKPVRRFFLRETEKISFWPVLLGNILTNLFMLFYLLSPIVVKPDSALDFWS